jgi:porphobilinogen synthase
MSILHRPRRLRATPALRRLVQEIYLHPSDFVYPLFVEHGENVKRPVASMPGVFNLSIDTLLLECEGAIAEGVEAIILFGLPSHKDANGSGGWDEYGIIPQAVAAVKQRFPEIIVMTDVCLCEYTDHGHCGIIENGEVQNDATLELLAKTAIAHAKAGADIIAPSDMMDGRVGAIRTALDEAGFSHIPILSYAVKYASAFYGPFRDAAGSAPQFGDRRSYQMNPAGGRKEALREAILDMEEGADMLMVKPAMAYLDILRDLSEATDLPLAAYHVSGEYAMIKAAAQNGWIDEKRVVLETMTGIKRAGASLILTYYAREICKWLTHSNGKKDSC